VIGRLRHRVAIQANTPTENAYGERQDSWAELETVYADVVPMTASEVFRLGIPRGSVTHRMRMRYRSDLGSGDVEIAQKYRAVYASRTFEIVALREEEPRKYLEVMVREVVP